MTAAGRMRGRIAGTRGGLVDADMPAVRVGAGVLIGASLPARVIAVANGRATLAPFGALDGIAAGTPVTEAPHVVRPVLGTALLGRAAAADGSPLDGGPRLRGAASARAHDDTGDRCAVRGICWTGVRAIDGPLAFARGARIGLFGAAGAGKSTLLAQIARGVDADAVVIGLVGERGREAERIIAACAARTTVICATSERAAAERVRAAEIAFAQARALCSRGLDVLLILDSLARTCAAQRELALAAGEPPGRGGYPPSVLALLARLLEGAGSFARGSITLVATVLSDGPDGSDPVSEAARAALDGHLVLSERLARAGWFPAIDLGASVSRTFHEAAADGHRRDAAVVRRAVAALDATAEARGLGLDPAAGDAFLARALAAESALRTFFCQADEPSPALATLTELAALADRMR